MVAMVVGGLGDASLDDFCKPPALPAVSALGTYAVRAVMPQCCDLAIQHRGLRLLGNCLAVLRERLALHHLLRRLRFKQNAGPCGLAGVSLCFPILPMPIPHRVSCFVLDAVISHTFFTVELPELFFRV